MNGLPPASAHVSGTHALGLLLSAAALEWLGLWLLAFPTHWMSHPGPPNSDVAQFAEAEIFELPPLKSLVSDPKQASPVAAPEKKITLKVNPHPQASSTLPPQENETQSSALFPPTHGPIPVYHPRPVIPDYLKTREWKRAVVVDFFVTARGQVRLALVQSSGEDELDILALHTLQQWQFRPAEQEHNAIDSRVRLRIVFDVR